MEELNTLKAFVIGPIGDKDTEEGSPARLAYEAAIEVLDRIIRPACEANGVDVLRADEINRPGDLVDQIFRLIRDSHVVIADLTGANPNVMYELGLRHSTGKLTIQLGEKNKLPFDVSTIRTIMFTRTPSGFLDAKRALLGQLGHALTIGADPVAATRIFFESSASTQDGNAMVSVGEDVAAAASPVPLDDGSADDLATVQFSEMVPDQENGFLESLAEMEEWFPSLQASINTVVAITSEVSGIFEEATPRLRAVQQGPTYSQDRLKIANFVGIRLMAVGIRLRVSAGDLQKSIDRIDPGMRFLLGAMPQLGVSLEDAEQLLGPVELLSANALIARDGAQELSGTVKSLGFFSRSMRTGAQDVVNALNSVAASSERVAEWGQLAPALRQALGRPGRPPIEHGGAADE